MSEIGDTEDEMDAELRGEPVNIAFNSRYLMDIFRNVSDETICVKMNSSTAPCIVTPKDGDGWLHLLLPVRTF
jgi:DNA polymerase-3 subunit beta